MIWFYVKFALWWYCSHLGFLIDTKKTMYIEKDHPRTIQAKVDVG
jgi:hypothetical protein